MVVTVLEVKGDLEVHLVSACVKHNTPDFVSQFVAIILNAFLTAFLSLSLPSLPLPKYCKNLGIKNLPKQQHASIALCLFKQDRNVAVGRS